MNVTIVTQLARGSTVLFDVVGRYSIWIEVHHVVPDLADASKDTDKVRALNVQPEAGRVVRLLNESNDLTEREVRDRRSIARVLVMAGPRNCFSVNLPAR